MLTQISIKDLGYNEFFEESRKKLTADNLEIARVISEYKGAYKVKNENGEYLGKVTGKQMFTAVSREDYPVVGDWVMISLSDGEQAVIREVLPRRTIIKRKYGSRNEEQIIASNVDVAFVVQAVDRDYNLNRFERYFAIIKSGGIRPVIILNKTDLISKEELEVKKNEIRDRFKNTDFILTSSLSNEGLKELGSYIEKGKTYCFLGSSGAGKSTLINKLLGQDIIKTNEISARSDRGKHTTTRREIFLLLDGGIVVDNPGMREIGMTDDGSGVNDLFDEIKNLAKGCKYPDCTHVHEPGCMVLAALKAGKLNEDQYSNYINLKKEADYYSMNKLERREKDKKFGKFVKRSNEELKRLK